MKQRKTIQVFLAIVIFSMASMQAVSAQELPLLDMTTNNQSSAFTKKHSHPLVQKLRKNQFRSDESIAVGITNTQNDSLQVEVLDSKGKKADVAITQKKTTDEVSVSITPQTQFRPGKYKLVVTDKEGYRSEQDFRWGVLAINTNKSIYQPGQTAALSLAVLDDGGEMVCDANVSLTIKNQSGVEEKLSIDNGKIVINPECHSHNFTLKPDYEASYVVGSAGTYDMILTAQTKNGSFTITDSLVVKAQTPFDVERTSATRIYPPNNYPVTMKITANQNFDGVVTETVPESFSITPSDEATTYDSARTVYLTKNDDPAAMFTSHLSANSGTASASLNAKDVLGASTSALLLPFAGAYSITQGFGAIETENILSKFYQKYSLSGHDGVDFGLPENTPLFAVDDGTVAYADNGDYGITVIIQHAWGKSYYGHLNKLLITKDSHITRGTQIGFSGNTGESTGPHLHFGIKPNNADTNNGYFGKVDPLPYFNLPDTTLIASNVNAKVTESNVLGASTSVVLSDTSSASASTKPAFTIQDKQLRSQALSSSTDPINDKVKVIQWHVSLKKGETTTLSYMFKAPQISPQFYLLGPLRFYPDGSTTSKPLFQEARQWQIASDAVGDAWYNDGTPYGGYAWQYRKAITMTSSSTLIPSTQTNFPVLVSLTSDPDLSTNAQSNGNDILFTDANGTKLNHEIEKYTSGTLIAWVNVTSLSTSSVIYMYYGNGAAASQQAATSVWDSNYKEVQHLEETGACAVTFTDSTSNAFNGSCVGSGPTANSTGEIGAARTFNGSTQYISIANNSAFNPGSTAFTVEAWIKTTDTTAYQDIMSHFDGLGGWAFHMNSGLANCPVSGFICLYDSNDSDGVSSGLSNNTWAHVVVSRSGTTATFYVNGTSIGTSTVQTTIPTTTNTERIGAEGDDSGFFSGSIDEVRYSSTNRTANWIKTEYSNQNSPSTFYTLGDVETKNAAVAPSQMMRHGQSFNTSGVIQPFVF